MKMIPNHESITNVAVIVLILSLQTLDAEPSKDLCPIGFRVAHDDDGDPFCYRKKRLETFKDKFQNCTGNLYTLKLLRSLSITDGSQTIWTDYKNVYDGGPFVDWSYTKDTGNLLETTFEVNRDSMYNVNEELCVVVDPVLNFTAVRCDEKHHRYCIVDVYKDPYDMTFDGCESMINNDSDRPDYLTDSEILQRKTYRFWSPMPSCLLQVVPKYGRQVRMTWSQSQKACESRGGSLLNRGWRYSTFPIFSSSIKGILPYPLYPFGVIASTNHSLLRYDAEHDNALIPQSDWYFESPMQNDTRLGAIMNDSWVLVNSSYIFYNVICEKTIPLRHVNLSVSIDSDDHNIILTVDDKDLQDANIYCFTDSSSYTPQRVKVIKKPGKPNYILKSIKDGYYWCTHSDSKNFYISESNKVLYIKVKDDTQNLYAVKLTSLARDYNLSNIDQLVQYNWKKKIEEYVFYSTKYSKTYGPSDSYDNHTIWKFRNDRPGMNVKNAHVVIKRVYLNSRSVLLHVKLHPSMLPVTPGQWDDIQIDFMRPAYFCEKKDLLTKRLALDEMKRTSVCKIYNCIGNFNEGVQLIITAEDTCYTPSPLNSSVSVELGCDLCDMILPTVIATESTTHHLKLQREVSSSDSSDEDDTNLSIDTQNNSSQPQNSTMESTPTYWNITTEYTTEYSNASTVAVNSTESENNTVSSLTTDNYTNPWSHSPRPPSLSTFPTPVITVKPTFPSTPELTTTPRPLPPQEQLEQVINDLTSLLNNTSEPLLVRDIEDSFDQVDAFLDDRDDLDIPGDLLHLLDELGARIDLNGTDDATTVRGNLALLVADAQPSAPVRGLKIAARSSDMFTQEAFEIIRDDINSSHLMADENEVVIQLPESFAAAYRRISFVVFRNDRAFQGSHGLYTVNSRILSVKIQNTTKFDSGEVIDIYLTPTEDADRNESRSCAFWKFLDDDSGSGYWSQDGCTFIRATTAGMLDTCRCDHLTHFAEVLIPRTVFSERNEIVLETISIVGCFMSIFGLIFVGITALMFRSWRRDYSNKIWLHLCISIFVMSIAFLIVIYAHFEEYDVLCMLTGILLHFSVLSSFCWMVVAAVLSYRRLVTVFSIDASHKLLRASAFAWGSPCAVIGVLLSIAPHAYSGRFDDKNPSTAFCYPSGLALWLSVFAPIALMLFVNWTLFALIVRSVFASRRNHPNRQVGNRHSSNRNEALRCASVSFFLVFLFGLPWLFGLFSMNVVMAYFFVILSTFQGFVLFLFFVLGNKNTRDLWLNKLKIKQTRKIPVTSSTYTNNRSTGGNVNSRSGNQAETIETKVSKPRSLSSLDDSRFS